MDRRSAIALVAAIVVIAAVVVAVLVFDDGEPTASSSSSAIASASASALASQSASAAPSASPSAAPSRPAGPIEVAWERVEGLEPGATVQAVSFVEDRWFALGQVFPEAAIWSSDDGRTWTRADIDGTGAPDEVTNAIGVAQLGETLVAIGSFGAMGTDQVAWVTWTSDDGGATWTEHRDGPASHALHAIVPGGPGLIGAGWAYGGTTPFDSFIAVSSDGIGWELTEAVFPSTQVSSLAAFEGRILAVGTASSPSGFSSAAWSSDDGGSTWSAAELPDAGRQFETAYDVIATDGGFVAAGGGIDGAVAWLSADGATWERVDIVDGAVVRALAPVDGGLVAAGNVAGQNFGPQLSWTSLDGLAWELGETFDEAGVEILAADGAGDTVVAGGQCLGDCATVLWVGEVAHR